MSMLSIEWKRGLRFCKIDVQMKCENLYNEKRPNPEEPDGLSIGAADWARASEREGNAVERAVRTWCSGQNRPVAAPGFEYGVRN
jgi:hypothetical protein